MALTIGVPRETFPGERRVALTPRACESLGKLGAGVIIEESAGVSAGFPDALYVARAAHLGTRAEVFEQADIIAASALTRAPIRGRARGSAAAARRPNRDWIRRTADGGGEAAILAERAFRFSPWSWCRASRGRRAWTRFPPWPPSRDIAECCWRPSALPKIFPMMMTAAGTITPAQVLVLGAGVAGLQAIATARRLGAVVSAYDVRSAVKEQIESLGAKFVVLDIEAAAEGQGGYAKAMDEAFYRRQREPLAEVMREQDVVITTAAVPGRKAPILITRRWRRRWPGLGDRRYRGRARRQLRADTGGRDGGAPRHVDSGSGESGVARALSCQPDVCHNIVNLLETDGAREGELTIDRKDEIIRETLVTHGGEVVNPRVNECWAAARLGGERRKMQLRIWICMFSCWRRFSALS